MITTKKILKMPFVKDSTYRALPFSPETPSDGNPSFLTVKELVEKMSKTSPGRIFQVRTVGIVSCDYGEHVLHEIGDDKAQIRLSLVHYSRPLPCAAKPYTAQVFGYVQNRFESAPVIYPHLLQSIPVTIALRIRETMKWVIDTHYAIHDNNDKED